MKNINYFKKFSIGTAQLGMNYGVANTKGQLSLEEMSKILSYAKKKGVYSLDTAIDYGESESNLGKLNVDTWDIISKISNLRNVDQNIDNFTVSKVRESIDLLKIKRLDTLLLHTPKDLLDLNRNNIYSAIDKCKEQGLCSKIGISSYSYQEVKIIIAKYKIDVVQFPLNIFNRELLESGLIELLKEKGIEVHVRSIFLQGLLLMKKEKRNSYFKKWNKLFSEWDQLLLNNQISNLEACLFFVLSLDNIDKIIIGIDSLEHFEEISRVIESYNDKSYCFKLSSNDELLINPSKWRLNQK